MFTARTTAALCLLLASAHAGHEWSSGDEAAANASAQAHNLTLPLSLSKSYTHYATQLRAHLLADYDKGVPPSSDRDGFSNSYAGADISMAIRFFKVDSVHAAEGRMSLKVWLRMSWSDERLSWDPADWGGVDQLQFMGGSLPAGAEITELWLPDIQPYNAYTGIHASLDPVHAMVSSSGSIFYSRPGMLDVMCKFSGLAAFPYDTLKCAVEFGGWGMSAYHQGLKLSGEGYSFSSQEATAGASYQEYSIQKIECEINTYFYACCADEPWPVATYRIYLNRASYYYTMLIVVPSILITLMSFAVFYTQPEACDALAYGITVVLASELMKIVLVGVLPVCGETVWIELFSQVNSFFCIFALIESVVQTVVEYTHESSFLPEWFLVPASYVVEKIKDAYGDQKNKNAERGDKKLAVPTVASGGATNANGMPAALKRRNSQELKIASAQQRAQFTNQSSVAGHVCKRLGGNLGEFANRARTESFGGEMADKLRENEGSTKSDGFGGALSEDDMTKIVFFENLFFDMDDEAKGNVALATCVKRVAFLAVLHSEADCKQLVEKADVHKDGVLTRLEFCELCVELLMPYPIELLRKSNENFELATTQSKRAIQAYWKSCSEQMDSLFSTIIPAVYMIVLGILFNMTMTDDYLTDNTAEMYEGVGPVSINGLDKFQVSRAVAVMRMLSPPIVFLAFFAASTTYGRVKASKKREAAKEKRRSSNGLSSTASTRNTNPETPQMMSQGV